MFEVNSAGAADAAGQKAHAFAFQQASLQLAGGFAHEDTSPRSHNSMPGNAAPFRADSHGVTSGASASAEPQKTRQLAVGNDAAFGNAPDELVDALPRRRRASDGTLRTFGQGHTLRAARRTARSHRLPSLDAKNGADSASKQVDGRAFQLRNARARIW